MCARQTKTGYCDSLYIKINNCLQISGAVAHRPVAVNCGISAHWFHHGWVVSKEH